MRHLIGGVLAAVLTAFAGPGRAQSAGGSGEIDKYSRYRYDRGILVSRLGGEITFDGIQVFLTTRF